MQMACKIIAFVQMVNKLCINILLTKLKYFIYIFSQLLSQLSCTFSLVTGILGLTGSGNVMELRGKEYDEKDDLLDRK